MRLIIALLALPLSSMCSVAFAQDELDCVNSPFLTFPFSQTPGEGGVSLIVKYDVASQCPSRQFIMVEADGSKTMLEKDLAEGSAVNLVKSLGVPESLANKLISGYREEPPSTIVETMEKSKEARRNFSFTNRRDYSPSYRAWVESFWPYKTVISIFTPLDPETERAPSSRPRLRIPISPGAAGNET